MYGTEFRFQKGDRIRLRDGVDPGFYEGMAKVGNVGVVTDRRRDRFGLPEVYVKWDRNHWAYNRQPDRWTFEDHFDLEERPVSDHPSRADMARKAAADFAETMAKLFAEPDQDPESQASLPVEQGPDADEAAARSEAIQQAASAMVEAEGFVTIVVHRKPHPDLPFGALSTEVYADCATVESEAIINFQLARLNAKFGEGLVTELIGRIVNEKKAAQGGESAA
jgi:hypothetical protein